MSISFRIEPEEVEEMRAFRRYMTRDYVVDRLLSHADDDTYLSETNRAKWFLDGHLRQIAALSKRGKREMRFIPGVDGDREAIDELRERGFRVVEATNDKFVTISW